MLQSALHRILSGNHLDRDEAYAAMQVIMNGEATQAQIGAFLAGLRMKGETPAEIAGFAACMREKAETVVTRREGPVVDIVGTGGDGKHTFNISTVTAFVVAGCGVTVAKHGNRAVSSKCGSADVLGALGVHIDLTAAQMSACLDEVGLAFLFAPKLHPAMRHAVGPRRELGVRTVFNILGPITNPAGVRRQLIGVYDGALLILLAEVLRQLQAEHVLLVHNEAGYDEITLSAPTRVAELRNGEIREYTLRPEDFGLQASPDGISGGNAEQNARIALSILNGEKSPARDVVVANAAAALYISGLATNLPECVQKAVESLEAGAAMRKLEALQQFTQRFTHGR